MSYFRRKEEEEEGKGCFAGKRGGREEEEKCSVGREAEEGGGKGDCRQFTLPPSFPSRKWNRRKKRQKREKAANFSGKSAKKYLFMGKGEGEPGAHFKLGHAGQKGDVCALTTSTEKFFLCCLTVNWTFLVGLSTRTCEFHMIRVERIRLPGRKKKELPSQFGSADGPGLLPPPQLQKLAAALKKRVFFPSCKKFFLQPQPPPPPPCVKQRGRNSPKSSLPPPPFPFPSSFSSFFLVRSESRDLLSLFSQRTKG